MDEDNGCLVGCGVVLLAILTFVKPVRELVVEAALGVFRAVVFLAANGMVAVERVLGGWLPAPPLVAWVLAGLVIGCLVHFVLHEAERLSRPLARPVGYGLLAVFVLVIAVRGLTVSRPAPPPPPRPARLEPLPARRPPEVTAPGPAARRVVAATPGIRLRMFHTTESDSMELVEQGTEVEVLAVKTVTGTEHPGSWYRVRLAEGPVGWLYGGADDEWLARPQGVSAAESGTAVKTGELEEWIRNRCGEEAARIAPRARREECSVDLGPDDRVVTHCLGDGAARPCFVFRHRGGAPANLLAAAGGCAVETPPCPLFNSDEVLVMTAGGGLIGHDLATGVELWRVAGAVDPRPAPGGGRIAYWAGTDTAGGARLEHIEVATGEISALAEFPQRRPGGEIEWHGAALRFALEAAEMEIPEVWQVGEDGRGLRLLSGGETPAKPLPPPEPALIAGRLFRMSPHVVLHKRDLPPWDRDRRVLWTAGAEPREMEWDDARKYCDALTVDGIDGWELPWQRRLSYLSQSIPDDGTELRRQLGLTGCCVWSRSVAGRRKAWIWDLETTEAAKRKKGKRFAVLCMKYYRER